MTGDGSDDGQWQARLLPFVVRLTVAFVCFFMLASAVQLFLLYQALINGPTMDIAAFAPPPASQDNGDMMERHRQSLVQLEALALYKRHHQAAVLLMSRVWLRYLAFAVGMTLCILGAAFILSRLRTDVAAISGEATGAKVSVSTASPGLLLVLIGAGLVCLAVLSNPAVTLTDGRAFVRNEDSPLPGVAVPRQL
jgi:hypothetical protein